MVTENHKRFLEHLSGSLDAVWVVAKWLQSSGYAVTVNPIKKAPSADQWKEYVDGGDLEIRQRVEIKHISRNFTGRQDWAFGDDFIVCARHSYDNAKPKPYAYIVVSGDYKACAIVPASTAQQWRVDKRGDSRYSGNYSQEFYFCPIELVQWRSL